MKESKMAADEIHDHAHGHAQDHASGHQHGIGGRGDGQVLAAASLNLILSAAQFVGGVLAGSVALLADALHNFSDGLAFVLALVARRIGRRPADPQMSFGYGRAETVAALVNYTALVMIALWLGYEALLRLWAPAPVTAWIVIALAGLGLVTNSLTALLTWRQSRGSANIRAAFLHNTADAATSFAVIVGGLLMVAYGWWWVDPAITLAISAWILWHALSEMKPVIRILMLAAPRDIAGDTLKAAILSEVGVADLHHLHLWQINEGRSALEAHLLLAEGAVAADVLVRVKARIVRDFGLTHSTFEVEAAGASCAASACD